jgi:hypothetical protein
MVPGTIHQLLLMLPLLCAQDAHILHLRLSRIIPPALPGPLPHVDQTSQRIIRQNGNNIECNDNQQTMVCTYINLQQACCPWHLLRDGPSTHALSPQMDTTGGQPSTYPPIKCYHPHRTNDGRHPQQTKGGQHARRTKGATRYSPAAHYNAPPIMTAPNSTKKWTLKNTKQTHLCVTCNNIPGSVPAITKARPMHPTPTAPERQSLRLAPQTTANPGQDPWVRLIPVPSGPQKSNLISQEAINVLTNCVWPKSPNIYTPDKLKCKKKGLNFEQAAMPMVHPTTSKMISSYKKLMHNPATSEIWQTAFGIDFGGMAQGETIKPGRKDQIQFFSWLTLKYPSSPRIKQSHTHAWW